MLHEKIKGGNLKFRETDLHVFMLGPKRYQQDLEHFVSIYNTRTRANREIWLLDGKYWKIEDINVILKGLKVDLDDDLYIITQQQSKTSVIEAYKIRQHFDFITLIYGNHTMETGLVLSSTEKWSRRRNLQVKAAGLFYLQSCL